MFTARHETTGGAGSSSPKKVIRYILNQESLPSVLAETLAQHAPKRKRARENCVSPECIWLISENSEITVRKTNS